MNTKSTVMAKIRFVVPMVSSCCFSMAAVVTDNPWLMLPAVGLGAIGCYFSGGGE